METPIFLFTGFLDSGKTSFIKDTLNNDDFREGDRILILACEEGEEEYTEEELARWNAKIEYIEDLEDFTEDFLKICQRKYRPEKILLEFNGMWQLEQLFQVSLPSGWQLVQMITTVNAQTFDLYLGNMRSFVMEQFKETDMVIFNRCNENTKKASYRRNVKAINPAAQVYFENEDGSESLPDESLPYDISQDTIELEDSDYGVWYIDAMDNPKKYVGKTMKFLAQFYHDKRMGASGFVPGRYAMVCCAEDIRFVGVFAKASPEVQPMIKYLKNRAWIYVTAKVEEEFCMFYRGKGPVLHVEKMEEAKAPEQDIVYFN